MGAVTVAVSRWKHTARQDGVFVGTPTPSRRHRCGLGSAEGKYASVPAKYHNHLHTGAVNQALLAIFLETWFGTLRGLKTLQFPAWTRR